MKKLSILFVLLLLFVGCDDQKKTLSEKFDKL